MHAFPSPVFLSSWDNNLIPWLRPRSHVFGFICISSLFEFVCILQTFCCWYAFRPQVQSRSLLSFFPHWWSDFLQAIQPISALHWCQSKGSTFSSVILRPWVEVRPRIEPRFPACLRGKRVDHDTTSTSPNDYTGPIGTWRSVNEEKFYANWLWPWGWSHWFSPCWI